MATFVSIRVLKDSGLWGAALHQPTANRKHIDLLLATCHHCSLSSRRGPLYRDSLAALSRNLRAPGCCHRPAHYHAYRHAHYHGHGHAYRPALQTKHHARLPRSDPPESIALARSKPAGSVKHLIFAHLRKLLTLSHARRRHEPGLNLLV